MDMDEKRSGRQSGESAAGLSDAKGTETEIHAPKPKGFVRRRLDKLGTEVSVFSCLAPFQKFRNFSMYFILNNLAGCSCVAFYAIMIFMGINILFQVIMVIIGFVYLDSCPMQPRIPLWNICAGSAFACKMFTAMMFLAVIRKDVILTGGVPEKTTIYKSPRYFCLFGVVDLILIACLILGMTLTMPYLPCMNERLNLVSWKRACGTGKAEQPDCDLIVYFFSLAAMIFLMIVYAAGYLLGLWVSGCFYTLSRAEEAAGKAVRGFSKLKNRGAWSIRVDEQEQKKKNKKKNKSGRLKAKKEKKKA